MPEAIRRLVEEDSRMTIVLAVLAASSVSTPLPLYRQCMRREIVSLEASGETPDDIATATWETCKDDLKKQLDAWKSLNESQEQSAIEYAERQVRPFIITHVVRLRACKKTPHCAARSLSWEEGL